MWMDKYSNRSSGHTRQCHHKLGAQCVLSVCSSRELHCWQAGINMAITFVCQHYWNMLHAGPNFLFISDACTDKSPSEVHCWVMLTASWLKVVCVITLVIISETGGTVGTVEFSFCALQIYLAKSRNQWYYYCFFKLQCEVQNLHESFFACMEHVSLWLTYSSIKHWGNILQYICVQEKL